ncbi:MAG: hypothetical protein ISS31_06260 [Kiritimatiellae bacterium]|nr:hypothetical protein [Kiritimatiellia bacterium]
MNAPAKESFLADPAAREAFDAQKGRIAALQRCTAFWHGTGAFQYAARGSKYGGVDHATVVNVLDSLMEQGLVPQDDLLSEQFDLEGHAASVSLTQRRLYAGVYAALYSHPDVPVQYRYGHRAFWWLCFWESIIFHALGDWETVKKEVRIVVDKLFRSPRDLLAQHLRFRQRAWLWTRTIRKDEKYATPFLHRIMVGCTSDIPGNHPLLIGAKHGAFEAIPLWRPAASYEARSAAPIPPSQWSCIEVPMSRVQSTKQALEKAGLDIPVVPIEFAELVCSNAPFDELTRPHDGWQRNEPRSAGAENGGRVILGTGNSIYEHCNTNAFRRTTS